LPSRASVLVRPVFLFVDRIVDLVPGKRAVGLSHVSQSEAFLAPGDPWSPDPDVLSVPPCILGEAAGQLAAWAVMAGNDFTRRPLGALIGRVEIVGQARRNDPVVLEVRLDDGDGESVVYHGVARVGASDVFRFENAFSPLLPVEDFDEPDALEQRFRRLHQPADVNDPSFVPAAGSPISSSERDSLESYRSAKPIHYGFDRVLDHDPGRRIVAERRFERVEPFFADHFTRRPVVPMTVLMECLLRLARRLLDEGSDGRVQGHRITVRHAKINRFILPDDSVIATVRLLEHDDRGARFHLRCEVDGRRVCQARVELVALER